MSTEPLIWHGCYAKAWARSLPREAFEHPAKFSRRLIDRIYDHGIRRGYWKPGDLIGDPFAGVCCGGLTAARHNLRWIGVELEPKFVEVGGRVLAKVADRARVVQGDSRHFARIVGELVAGVTSPPYAGSIESRGDGIDWDKACERGTRTAGRGAIADGYGSTPGQIGALPGGRLNGVATSPPWEDQESAMNAGKFKDPAAFAAKLAEKDGFGGRHKASAPARMAQLARAVTHTYGESDGQIGNIVGETYWQAVAAVYDQVHQALKPGGVLCVVVKDYVKKRRRVALSDDTAALLARVGFEPLERVHAMLVEEERALTGHVIRRRERKSFFRRLAESKGSPRIDHEDVLFVRKPA